ncbi:MAG: hydroxymethylglutaryl-CoA synthase [Acidobacteriota bacterium]
MSTDTPQAPSPSASSTGIASIGIQLPSLALPVTTLAELRGVDPAKFVHGLGCSEIALCDRGEGVVELAVGAARRALERWDGDRSRIGLLAVGTESAVDMSRPLSAWVADALDLAGAVRSYEVKHACYGGTLALRQAVEWRRAGAALDPSGTPRAALVVAADVSLYEPASPGEPTQGAGAVAFVVDEARIAELSTDSWAWSEPAFDFWRPVGEAYPRVDGPFSLDCYKRAAERCVGAYLTSRDLEGDGAAAHAALDALNFFAFHVPFPKMVKKAVRHVGETLGWSEEQADALFESQVVPTLGWSRRVGNSYTASLWLAVAEGLAGAAAGTRSLAFSYGSGFGSELVELTAGPAASAGAWRADVEADVASRRILDGAEYLALRAAEQPAVAAAVS